MDTVADRLDAISKEHCVARRAQLIEDATTQLDDAKQQIDNAKDQLSEGSAEAVEEGSAAAA